jgi:hypothetical protein
VGADYNSGLPFGPDLSPQQYALQYGQVMINHLNFVRDRIHPFFTQNASVGADLYQREKCSVRMQADATNLSNTLEVIDSEACSPATHSVPRGNIPLAL